MLSATWVMKRAGYLESSTESGTGSLDGGDAKLCRTPLRFMMDEAFLHLSTETHAFVAVHELEEK